MTAALRRPALLLALGAAAACTDALAPLPPLAGTWQIVSITPLDPPAAVSGTLTFNDDGSYAMVVVLASAASTDTLTGGGAWQLHGHALSLSGEFYDVAPDHDDLLLTERGPAQTVMRLRRT